MRINNINTTNFTSRPVARCHIKTAYDNSEQSATIYLLDKADPKDAELLRTSRYTPVSKQELSNITDGRNYYVVMNDEDGDVVSFAKTSRRYSNKGDKRYIALEELEGNRSFVDPCIPVLSCVVRNNCDTGEIKTSFRAEDRPELKDYQFLESGDAHVWALPQSRYHEVANRALSRNQIEFLA